jgi:transposase
MRAKGLGVAEIARRLGVTRMGVYQWLWHYGADGLLLDRRRRRRGPSRPQNRIRKNDTTKGATR